MLPVELNVAFEIVRGRNPRKLMVTSNESSTVREYGCVPVRSYIGMRKEIRTRVYRVNDEEGRVTINVSPIRDQTKEYLNKSGRFVKWANLLESVIFFQIN